MKKRGKTALELESAIKIEMEDTCDQPCDMIVSVQADGGSWRLVVSQEGPNDDAERREMVERIAQRLKAQFDLKH